MGHFATTHQLEEARDQLKILTCEMDETTKDASKPLPEPDFSKFQTFKNGHAFAKQYSHNKMKLLNAHSVRVDKQSYAQPPHLCCVCYRTFFGIDKLSEHAADHKFIRESTSQNRLVSDQITNGEKREQIRSTAKTRAAQAVNVLSRHTAVHCPPLTAAERQRE